MLVKRILGNLKTVLGLIVQEMFPPVLKIETPEEAEALFQYEVSNHPDLDPFRPLEFLDHGAGRKKEQYRRLTYHEFIEYVDGLGKTKAK